MKNKKNVSKREENIDGLTIYAMIIGSAFVFYKLYLKTKTDATTVVAGVRG